jgi:hypothetical protein
VRRKHEIFVTVAGKVTLVGRLTIIKYKRLLGVSGNEDRSEVQRLAAAE